MNTRKSALYRRTERYNRRGATTWLGAGSAIAFALAPLGVMLWALPVTGIGIA